MPASIVTQLKLDDKELKSKLQAVEKYTKQTYGQWLDSTAELNKKTKELSKQQEQLARATKSLNAERAKGEQADLKRIARYEKFIKLNKQTIKQTRLEATAIRTKTNAQKSELNSLNQVTASKKASEKATGNLTNSVVRHLRQIETLIIAYYALSAGFSNTIGVGINVNRMMEDNTSGIAALLSANTQMVLSNGEVVNSYEKFRIGQQVATKTMDDLRKASVKTYATFPQLTEIFQQAIGQTLSMGDAFGSTVDEINDNTIKLAQRMSNIGGAIGQPMDRIREEIRSLLSGNASTDSLIATMIFGSPGEANKAIRMAKDRGKDGLTQLLNSVLEPFDILEGVSSYTRSLLQLEDAWSQAMATMSKPVFDDLKVTFETLAKDINANQENITEGFEDFYEGAKDVASILDDVAVAATAFYGAKAVTAVYAMIKAQKLLNLAILANPYVIATTTAVGIYEASQNWEALGDTILDVAGTIAEVSDEAFGTNLGDNVDYNTKRFNDFKDSIVDVEEVLKEFGGTIEEAIYKPFDLGFNTEDFKRGLADAKSALQSVKIDLELAAINGNKEEIKALQKEYQALAVSIATLTKQGAGQGGLQTLIPADAKFLESAEKQVNKELEKTIKLEQDIVKAKAQILQYNKRIASAKKAGEEDIKSQENIVTLNKKIKNDTKEIAKIQLEAKIKILEAENELWIAEQNLMGVEVKKSDMIRHTIAAKGEELLLAEEGVEFNKQQAEILRLVLRYNQEINKEEKKSKKEVEKNLIDMGQFFAQAIHTGIQDGFDGDFDLGKIASQFASSLGSAMVSASITSLIPKDMGAEAGFIGGIALMGLSSLFGGDKGKSQAELADERFDAFMDSLDKASKSLLGLGNVGTDISLAISSLQGRIVDEQKIIVEQTAIKVALEDRKFTGTHRQLEDWEDNMDIMIGAAQSNIDLALSGVSSITDELNTLIKENISSFATVPEGATLSELSAITGITDLAGFNADLADVQADISAETIALKKEQIAWGQMGKSADEISNLTDAWIENSKLANLLTDDIYLLNLNYADFIDEMNDLETERIETIKEANEDMISSLGSTFESLQGTIDSLKGAAGGSAYTMDLYNQSMKKTQALLASGDTDAFMESLAKTQGLTSVLMDQSAFEEYGRTAEIQQAFAQSVAANQFEAMQADVQTEIDILNLIEENTRVSAVVDVATAPEATVGVGYSSIAPSRATANTKSISRAYKGSTTNLGASDSEVITELKEQNNLLRGIVAELSDSRDIQQASLDLQGEETA